MDAMSYAYHHRLAAREARRIELGRAFERVRLATHVAVTVRRPRVVYHYGDRASCEAFAAGLRELAVEKMTDADRDRQNAHLSRTYGR